MMKKILLSVILLLSMSMIVSAVEYNTYRPSKSDRRVDVTPMYGTTPAVPAAPLYGGYSTITLGEGTTTTGEGGGAAVTSRGPRRDPAGDTTPEDGATVVIDGVTYVYIVVMGGWINASNGSFAGTGSFPNQGNVTEDAMPLGSSLVLLLMAMLYLGVGALRRRRQLEL